jgi:ATP-dependent exoDNAse (exonuclease V) beta subunit
MTKRTLKDQADRDKAAGDLGRSYIVEAAAGTGKTTLLVSRILNLIRGKKALPEEIVAITFTERAAAELKMKLQESLQKHIAGTQDASKPGGTRSPADPDDAQDTATQTGSEDTSHLAEALWSLERMQVTTIHSFCASLIRERPVEAEVDPNFDVADELMSSIIEEEPWEEWLARRMDERAPCLARALAIGITIQNMQDLAGMLLANRDVLDYLPENIGWNPSEPEFREVFKESIRQLSGLARDHCQVEGDAMAALIEELQAEAEELKYLKDEGETTAHLFKLSIPSPRTKGNQGNWETKDCLKETRAEVSALREAHLSFKAWLAHNIVVDLARGLEDFVESYRRTMSDGAHLDFHDLLLYARNMLASRPEVRDYFGTRYKYILVDEFQDTDPLQAEIIFFLSEAKGGRSENWEDVKVTPGRLFLVGDPKQSIYRFRRADIEMYASAKAHMGKGHSLSIFQNFRCTPSIIDVVNTIFRDLIVSPDDGAYQPDYVALEFGRDKKTVPKGGDVFLMYPPESVAGKMEHVGPRRKWETRAIAASIQRMVNEDKPTVWDKTEERLRPLMLRDIAILLRTHTPLNHLEDALKLFNVDYRVIGGKYFFQRQEIRQLLAVLVSIVNPYDRVALVAALRSPFFGVSDEDIFLHHSRGGRLNYLESSTGSSLEASFSLLRRLHETRNDSAPEEILRKLYTETKAPVVFLLKPGGEQRVHNLLKIGDIARALADRGVNTFRAFVRWLDERQEEEADESEAATVEAGDDFVRILTVHKAKGLEFPVVFLADLASTKSEREPFIADRRGADIAIQIGGVKKGIQTSNYPDLKTYELRRIEAEERRLLYVAMTRPRDMLVLPVYWATPGELEKETGRPREKSLLHYLADSIPLPSAAKTDALMKGMKLYPTSRLNLEPREPAALKVKVTSSKPAAPAAFQKRKAQWETSMEEFRDALAKGRALKTATEAEIEAEAIKTKRPAGGSLPSGTKRDWTKSDGARFGSIVHDVLETADWTRHENLKSFVAEKAEAVQAPAGMTASIVKTVEKTLKSDLIRRILASDRYYKEVPFAFKKNGTIVEGKIDVLFEEDGEITIVDFKTDKVTKTDLKKRVEHYRPQVETYRQAVTAACGKSPKEVILFFLHPMVPVTVDLPPPG